MRRPFKEGLKGRVGRISGRLLRRPHRGGPRKEPLARRLKVPARTLGRKKLLPEKAVGRVEFQSVSPDQRV